MNRNPLPIGLQVGELLHTTVEVDDDGPYFRKPVNSLFRKQGDLPLDKRGPRTDGFTIKLTENEYNKTIAILGVAVANGDVSSRAQGLRQCIMMGLELYQLYDSKVALRDSFLHNNWQTDNLVEEREYETKAVEKIRTQLDNALYSENLEIYMETMTLADKMLNQIRYMPLREQLRVKLNSIQESWEAKHA